MKASGLAAAVMLVLAISSCALAMSLERPSPQAQSPNYQLQKSSFLQTKEAEGSAAAVSEDDGGRPVGFCDVCRYVVENKERRQPYLCRGLKDANYQRYCVRTMEALVWWMNNEVYWINYGCQRSANGVKEWVRPCPSSAICSWIEDFELRKPFCAADSDYPKPQ